MNMTYLPFFPVESNYRKQGRNQFHSRENFIFSIVPLCPPVCESLGDHLVVGALVDPDILAARAVNAAVPHEGAVHPDDSLLVATKNLALPYLVIAPEFFLAGGTADGKHRKYSEYLILP